LKPSNDSFLVEKLAALADEQADGIADVEHVKLLACDLLKAEAPFARKLHRKRDVVPGDGSFLLSTAALSFAQIIPKTVVAR